MTPNRARLDLDGTWSLVLDPAGSLGPQDAAGGAGRSVQVPATWQSQAADLYDYTGVAWYRRAFDLPADWTGNNAVLGFGAVDYQAEVFVNGAKAGAHEGGYLPFELDVTRLVRPGANELLVRVCDDLASFPEVPHGKQSWYGYQSGLWQSVWLERRPAIHITHLAVSADAAAQAVTARVRLSGPLGADQSLSIEVISPSGERVAEQTGRGLEVTLSVTKPELWDLDTPRLFTLRASLEATSPDAVTKTFGFRTIEARDGRIWLNGRPIYLRAALDQDFYPTTTYVPPSTAYIEAEFQKALDLGLNCLRVHIKVADPRYYEAADRLGLLIWTELPNWAFLTAAARQRGRETLEGMVARDGHHPSIIIWTIINESWGIDLSDPNARAWLAETYDFMKGLDPSRLVVGNSACAQNAQVVTDLEDFHVYRVMPDHSASFTAWVEDFARGASWTYAHAYRDYASWRDYLEHPYQPDDHPYAPEVRRSGSEPKLVSEFGNWGLPDLDALYQAEGGEPWWFDTGLEWGGGVVYPHGIEQRFRALHLDRSFGSLANLTRASRDLELASLKFEIEQMRRQDPITGYVITEFTDVYWESNGLLDMHRNAKVPVEALRRFNADDVLVPTWERLAYWGGEPVQVNVALSHFSTQSLRDCQLEWHLDQWPELSGVLAVPNCEPARVTDLGQVAFAAPAVSVNVRAQLVLRLRQADGRLVAESTQELFFFASPASRPRVRLYAPELKADLAQVGYQMVDRLDNADVVVAQTLTDDLRGSLLAGGRVLWLAEEETNQQSFVGTLRLRARPGSAWEGDWANSLSWVCQDQLFGALPTKGIVDFLFAGLTPETVITGLSQHEFASSVHAGLAVGWLHHGVALVAERPVGEGRLLVSTFQLSRHLLTHPVADVVFSDLVQHAARAG